MSGAMREKNQGDFDLERFIDIMDEAMTSDDPRVIETLRKLMMIVAMTRPEDHDHFADRRTGPLRTMYDDVRSCHRRISDLEEEFRISRNQRMQAEMQVDPDVLKRQAAAQIAQHNLAKVAYQINSGGGGLNLAQSKGLYKK